MAVVLQTGGKTKQFRTNQQDTIRYMPEVRDKFYFLCLESLEFPFCSNLGHVYIYQNKGLSVGLFTWWHQLTPMLRNKTLARLKILGFFFSSETAYMRLIFFFKFEVRREVIFQKITSLYCSPIVIVSPSWKMQLVFSANFLFARQYFKRLTYINSLRLCEENHIFHLIFWDKEAKQQNLIKSPKKTSELENSKANIKNKQK